MMYLKFVILISFFVDFQLTNAVIDKLSEAHLKTIYLKAKWYDTFKGGDGIATQTTIRKYMIDRYRGKLTKEQVNEMTSNLLGIDMREDAFISLMQTPNPTTYAKLEEDKKTI